jgi:restriction endonuclease Mrr
LVQSSTKSVRLSKIARDLNCSIITAVLLLKKVGINAEENPNFRVSEEEYITLKKELSQLKETIVTDPTLEIIEWITKDYKNLSKINPEKFEKIIAYLLLKNGYMVKMCGKTYESDGGIDIIAWKIDIVTVIIAVQVKYKYNLKKKVTSGEVRDFVGAMQTCNQFNAGMLVTNSSFSPDSRWIEELGNIKIELKDSEDIQEWLKGNYESRKFLDKEIHLNKKKIIRLKE